MKTKIKEKKQTVNVELNVTELRTIVAALIVRCETFKKAYNFEPPAAEKIRAKLESTLFQLTESY